MLKLVKSIGDASGRPVNLRKKIKELDAVDWAVIMQAFNEWPFAPQVSGTVSGSLDHLTNIS